MAHPSLRRIVAVTPAITASLVLATAGPARAQTFTVTSTFSLAQAIAAANANPGPDTITFDPTITAIGAGVTYTITDTVLIDACRQVDADPATFDTGVQIDNGAPQFVIDAPDVTMQGFTFGGATTAIEVTPEGDRFRVRGAVFALNSAAAVHVDRAEDVTIGGAAPAPCSGQTGASIVLSQTTGGIVLDAAVDTTIEGAVSRLTLGPAVLVYGGSGVTVRDSELNEALGGGGNGSVVDVSGSGTAAAPFRLVDTEVGDCLADCVRIRDDSVFDIGATDPAQPMTIRRVFDGYGGALVHISESSGTLHDTRLSFSDASAVIIDDGAHDVTVERTEISSGRSHGILLDGPTQPTGITLRDNWIGYRLADDGTGTIRPVTFPNRGSGVVVRAGSGVLVGGDGPDDGNLIAANEGSGVQVLGGSGARVVGNLIGPDPVSESVPTNGFDLWPQLVGVLIDGAPGVEVRGNTIGATTSHGVRVAGSSAGTVVAGNRIGTDAAGSAAPAPIAGSGVSVAAADVTVRDNTIGDAAIAAVTLDAEATRVVVVGNRIGARPDGTPAAALASPAGIMVAGDANVIGSVSGTPADANIVTLTGGTDAAIVVSGQRNTVRANSVFLNAGDGIALTDAANGGMIPPGVDSAEATGVVLAVTGAVGPGSPGAGGPWTIDVYANTGCARGDLEGQLHLGSVVAAGTTFGGAVAAPPTGYEQLTYTSTDAAGNTSEFGGCTQVLRVPDPAPSTSATTAAPTTTSSVTSAPGSATTNPPASTGQPSSGPPPTTTPGPADPGTLPATGSSPRAAAALAVALVALGVGMVRARRRAEPQIAVGPLTGQSPRTSRDHGRAGRSRGATPGPSSRSPGRRAWWRLG